MAEALPPSSLVNLRGNSNIKERIGLAAPRWLVRTYRRIATAAEFWRDCRDYNRSTLWKYGRGRGVRDQDGAECLDARLTIAYHGIEKGAAFPDPKRPYGLLRLAEIDELLAISASARRVSPSAAYAKSAVSALDHYNNAGEISDTVTPVSNWDGRAYPSGAISEFVNTRHSVRSFDTTAEPSIDQIAKIVAEASTTPSVCNRRTYRAHYFNDRDEIDAVLALQNGNRGFGHTIPGLFVVTVRRSAFVGAGERNQRWVDGGLFAMTLVWLCHAHGLGTCFLNWSQTNARTARLREVANIPTNEDVITMIAVGHAAPGHRVARSPMRAEAETFVHHLPGTGRLR